MMDASVVIVKPEIIAVRGLNVTRADGPIASSLIRRKYNIKTNGTRDNWREFAREIYSCNLTPNQLQAYLEGYDANGWGDMFSFFVVEHEQANTLPRLKLDQGSFRDYQKRDKDTLRAEFGLAESFNRRFKEMILTYSGVHCPGDEAELLHNIGLLGLEHLF